MMAVRTGTARDRSRHAIYLIAPVEQLAAHSGAPLHRKHLLALLVASSNTIISHGHARWQNRQPVHFFTSTTRAPVFSSRTIAEFGHAVAHGSCSCATP